MTTAARRTYTIKETAQVLGIGTRQTYELARSGVLPARRLGRRWVVPIAALHTYLGEAPASSEGAEA